ncbi:MAG: ATP-binding protein [Longimicrobiales bacterium]
MIPRLARLALTSRLAQFPAVVLIGPRQVGKTTLARELVDRLGDGAVYVDLERPSDVARLADAERYFELTADRLVVLDEIHRTPDVFGILRGVIDRRRRAGRRSGQFLLLGSASLDLLRQSSESLAGRASTLELTPLLGEELVRLAVPERRASPGESVRDTLERLWTRGGFPDSYLAGDAAASYEWRLAFIQTYLERDIPMLGPRIPAETLRRFWTMLAHGQGGLLNAARLASGLAVSGQTISRYLDLLVDLLLVRRLQPWVANTGKRLIRSPKIYVRDSGIVHGLLGLPSLDAVLGHPVAGGSWEGLVVENLIAAAPAGSQAGFYRTSAGAEIDLLLEPRSGERWAIEIKRSSAPSVSRGFRSGCDDVGATQRMVVYPGEETFPLEADVRAVGLLEAVKLLRRVIADG